MSIRRLTLILLVLMAPSSSALEASASTTAAPTVVTDSATEVGPFKAKLNGRVDPNTRPTEYYFEYGKTTSYGTKTAMTSAGSGDAAISVSEVISGLSSGTTYHFRIVATNDAGIAKGVDRTFATDPAPTVHTGSATDVAATSATLNGSVNPQGRPATYFFEYGQTASYGSQTPSASAGSGRTSVNVAVSVGALKPGTRYHYRIVASSEAGTSNGSDRSFTTKTTPSVVTGGANDVAPTSSIVTGQVNPNGRSTTSWFEFGATTSYGTRTSERSVGSGTSTVSVSETLTGLTPGTTYHYRLVARSSAGTQFGKDATFATPGPPIVVTGAPQAVSTTWATISGSVTANGRASTWFVEYGRTTGYGLRTGSLSAGAGTSAVVVSTRLSGLTPGLRYHYRVVAVSDAGTTVGSDASFATAPLPRNPSGGVVHCTLTGTQSSDLLRGTFRRDVICGLGGNDRIVGLGGNDVIYGGPGDDVIYGGDGSDALYGGIGRDSVFGEDGADRIYGGGGSNQLFGGYGADLLVGGALGDSIVGGYGRDRIFAGGGNDVIYARDGAHDIVDGGSGRDVATADRIDTRRSIERRR